MTDAPPFGRGLFRDAAIDPDTTTTSAGLISFGSPGRRRLADAGQHALGRLEIGEPSSDRCAFGIEACKPVADLRSAPRRSRHRRRSRRYNPSESRFEAIDASFAHLRALSAPATKECHLSPLPLEYLSRADETFGPRGWGAPLWRPNACWPPLLQLMWRATRAWAPSRQQRDAASLPRIPPAVTALAAGCRDWSAGGPD